MMSYMDTSSDVSHTIVVTSYMDMSSDVAHAIVVTSYMDTSCDVAHAIVVMSYMNTSSQASTSTYLSTCPFGQLTKKSTCQTQSFSCLKI